ncbi:hypothetical protein N7462_004379 [Penicillium macrosclerotiorum]|uniref:uncharacterized protein n=1 Tax=Penicillium macrosclerotiorum TaxID=303699 RepID=UPI0025488688|nr:uncharacterized protein N7462_004379 [Penicillium macrosclerotiorum]KAJ5689987.1 hypothetical protein N7462_004379 [Penicillium macrosclerotiorum]
MHTESSAVCGLQSAVSGSVACGQWLSAASLAKSVRPLPAKDAHKRPPTTTVDPPGRPIRGPGSRRSRWSQQQLRRDWHFGANESTRGSRGRGRAWRGVEGLVDRAKGEESQRRLARAGRVDSRRRDGKQSRQTWPQGLNPNLVHGEETPRARESTKYGHPIIAPLRLPLLFSPALILLHFHPPSYTPRRPVEPVQDRRIPPSSFFLHSSPLVPARPEDGVDVQRRCGPPGRARP